ncbi:Retrotrans gag domain-containing protein [Abeliophyllum distichum]|uniref:Retrotrans gag domain-containing protein n=1 Tax=Abeliophyllum distichum TaxID=126358 RepID=A0ABD1RSR7_9LAMI
MITDIAQLNDIQKKEGETVKSYFKRFSNVINKIETMTDEKALDALVTGLHMRTPFWRDVQNNQPKTYSQLVDLVQREIKSEETIKNREKAERERRDRYRREGRRSSDLRFSRF